MQNVRPCILSRRCIDSIFGKGLCLKTVQDETKRNDEKYCFDKTVTKRNNFYLFSQNTVQKEKQFSCFVINTVQIDNKLLF